MIIYEQVYHCLQSIISFCENAEPTDAGMESLIEEVLHTANHAIDLMDKAENYTDEK